MSRRHLIFALVGLALLMGSIDNTIVSVGLPAMKLNLGASLLLIGWTITVYQLGQLTVLPLAGKLSDELGRKRVFLAAVLVFTTASFLCGFAPNVYVLIACRFLQALGGGAFLPACTGIVADLFEDNRARAIGLFSSIFPIGGVIAPNIGGAIIDHLSWRYLFYINVPIGIAVIVLTWIFYRAPAPQRSRQRPDFGGVSLYATAILLFLVTISWIGQSRGALTHQPIVWLLALSSVALMLLFVRHERRTPEPMLDLALLRERPFLAANAYAFIWGAGVFGFVAFLPTYAQLHYHMTATQAGALLTPRGVVMIVTSTLASFYLIRSGYRLPMIVGVLVVTVSLLLTSLSPGSVTIFGLRINSFVYLASVIALLGIGFGLSGPASNNAAVDLMPQKIAALTGVRAMFRLTGGTIGTGITVFVVSLFADPGRGLQVMFIVLGLVLLFVIPAVFLIPDMARDARRAMQTSAGEAADLVPAADS